MRIPSRAAAAFALAALPFLATPAAASPEDGKGCAGLPAVPATYVCLVAVTPENALPSAGIGTTIPVTVPRFCYVAGCHDAVTVDVPVPRAQPGDGVVVMLWHQGRYIPIGAGTLPAPADQHVRWVSANAFAVADITGRLVFGYRWPEYRDCVLYASSCPPV